MSESRKSGGSAPNEVQKMIEKLKAMNMYELGMTPKEMSDLLTTVKASETSANSQGANENGNKSPETMRQENQPSYSSIANSKPSDRSSASPESKKTEKRSETNDERSPRAFNKKAFARENREGQPSNSNKSRQSTNDNFNESTIVDKHIAQRNNSTMRNTEISKFEINPLGARINPNDVPLQPRYRVLPIKDRADIVASANFNEAHAKLSNDLKRVAEIWRSQRGSSVVSSVPWAKPIQVDDDDERLDDDYASDEPSEKAGPSGTNVDADTARKQRCGAKTFANSASREVDENDDSDDDFSPASTSKRIRVSKGADSSEKARLTVTAIVEAPPSKSRGTVVGDDVRNDEYSDEEFSTRSKRRKTTRRAGSSERTNSSKDFVVNEATKRRKDRRLGEDDDDDDDVYEWETSKVVAKKIDEPQKVGKKIKTTKFSSTTETVASKRTIGDSVSSDSTANRVGESDERTARDRAEINRTSMKPEKNRTDDAVSSTSSSYPRRIVPPVPKGGGYSGIRARCVISGFAEPMRERNRRRPETSGNEDVTVKERKNRDNGGSRDKDIVEVLENMDGEKIDSPRIEIAEIRPLRLSSRMKLQLDKLKATREREEEEELRRAEARRMREERIVREKEERIKQRLKEQSAAIRREEQEAKAKIATEARWNMLMKQREKKGQTERTELNPEGPRRSSDVHTIEETSEDCFEMESNDFEITNDDRRGNVHRSKNVPCPICGKKFSAELIEDHAGTCEDYGAIELPAVSTRPTSSAKRRGASKLYECAVCSVFKSDDGCEFEDHVSKCVTRRRDTVLVGTSTVVTVPDSPIRGFRKISEQPDSEINYREQFVPKTKSRVGDNRKRKRR